MVEIEQGCRVYLNSLNLEGESNDAVEKIVLSQTFFLDKPDPIERYFDNFL